MDPAHDNGDAPGPEVRRDLVGAVCLRGEGRDAEEIRTGLILVVRDPKVLVDDCRLPVLRGEAGENHETQGFPHSIPTPAAATGLGHVHEGIGRIDQQ